MSTIRARLARLEQRSQPDPARAHFTIVTSDDEGGPDTDDQGRPVVRFTIRIDRANGDAEVGDA